MPARDVPPLRVRGRGTKPMTSFTTLKSRRRARSTATGCWYSLRRSVN